MRKRAWMLGVILFMGFLGYSLLRQKSDRIFIFDSWKETAENADPDKRDLNPINPQTSSFRRANETDFFVDEEVSFSLIKQQAESGDPLSQRRLSEIYEDCALYSVDSKRYFKTLDELSSGNPDSQPHIEKIKKQTQEFCRHVDGGQPIPIEAYVLWQEQSAKAGDLIAGIRQAARGLQGTEQKQIDSFIDAVRSSKDPQALYELSHLAKGYQGEWKDEEKLHLFGKSYSNHAIAIAACRAGMNCSSTSRLMRQVCTAMFRCKYANYEEFVFAELVPPAQRREVEGLVTQLNVYFFK